MAGLSQWSAAPRCAAKYRTNHPSKKSSRCSPDVVGPKLDADPRSGRTGRLRYPVLPGPLAAAAHHDEIPVPQVVPERRAGAAVPRSQQQRPRLPEGDDRDHRVLARAAPDRVAVQRDAVAPVPVEAQTRRREPLAQLGLVMGVERVPAGVKGRVGQGLVRTVEPKQSRHVDRPVVHPPPLRLPRHRLDQPPEQRRRPRQPSPLDVDPGSVTERYPLRAQRRRRRLVPEVEQRVLNSHTHTNMLSQQSNARSTDPVSPAQRGCVPVSKSTARPTSALRSASIFAKTSVTSSPNFGPPSSKALKSATSPRCGRKSAIARSPLRAWSCIFSRW